MTTGARDQARVRRPEQARPAAFLDVLLKPIWVERVGYRYDVILDGETIVYRSRDPEHDAARALLVRGFRGKFRTIDFNTGRPRMIVDIVKAARLTVIERDDTGLAVVLHRPMSADDRMRVCLHRSHQGRVIPERAVPGAQERLKRAGGETAEVPRAIPGKVLAVEVA